MSAVNPMAGAKPPPWLANLQKANAARARCPQQSLTLERIARVVLWAQGLRTFPSVRDFMDRWGCNRATAYRWRAAIAAAYGIDVPANPPGESGGERLPDRATQTSRRVL